MAATKLIAMHQNKGRSVMRCLKDRTDYAMNGEKTDEGKYFGVKTLRAEDTEAADEIREKHESLRRRKMLRSQEKI